MREKPGIGAETAERLRGLSQAARNVGDGLDEIRRVEGNLERIQAPGAGPLAFLVRIPGGARIADLPPFAATVAMSAAQSACAARRYELERRATLALRGSSAIPPPDTEAVLGIRSLIAAVAATEQRGDDPDDEIVEWLARAEQYCELSDSWTRANRLLRQNVVCSLVISPDCASRVDGAQSENLRISPDDIIRICHICYERLTQTRGVLVQTAPDLLGDEILLTEKETEHGDV